MEIGGLCPVFRYSVQYCDAHARKPGLRMQGSCVDPGVDRLEVKAPFKFSSLSSPSAPTFSQFDQRRLQHRLAGYLGSSPDPACQFPAYTSPKNTGRKSKIILFSEYDRSNL